MRRGFVDGRWVVGFLIVVPIAVAIGASLVPRLGPREIMRHQVGRILADYLPTPVDWERIEVSLDPPRLTVQGVTAGVASNAEPLIRAKTVSLEVEPDALRRGLVELREGVVEEMVLWLEWSGEQWRWKSGEVGEPERVSEEGAVGDVPDAASPEGGVLPRWTLQRSRVWIVDAAVEPPRKFEFSGLEAEARPTSDGFEISGSGAFLGGSFRVRARTSESPELKGALALEGNDLAALAAYAPPGSKLSGIVSGTLMLEVKTSTDWSAEADLSVREAELQIRDLELEGLVELRGRARPTTPGTVSGDVRIGATDAALDLGGVYAKPPGKPAEVSGEFQVESGRKWKIGAFRLSIGSSDAETP